MAAYQPLRYAEREMSLPTLESEEQTKHVIDLPVDVSPAADAHRVLARPDRLHHGLS